MTTDALSAMLCTACPMADCDEESVHCSLRWATRLNDAQRELMHIERSDRPVRRIRRTKPSPRADYFHERYKRRRERHIEQVKMNQRRKTYE